jgi:hypothetical protein
MQNNNGTQDENAHDESYSEKIADKVNKAVFPGNSSIKVK